jgi:hypothetical protein
MLELMKSKVTGFWKEEDGLGTLELILIIGVIIIIALLFRTEIERIVGNLLKKVDTKSDQFFPG